MAAHFMWYELLTSDPKAAERFYRDVVGWKTEKMGEGDGAYTIYATDAGGVAGMPPQADMPAGPFWMGYVGVDDVDGFAEKVKAAGGAIHTPPHEIPGVGRSAMVADPQGAVFTLFKGNQPAGPPAGQGPGFIGWHELSTSEPKAGFDFYAEVFGWKPLDAMDMGEAGSYQIYSEDGAQPSGGVMKKAATTPRPWWAHYFNVDSASAAAERVNAAGGQVSNGPHEVPGGQWTLEARDPQGARFALVGGK
ncbi:MAG TPA: VOC family protein [Caulobacteraceae bacterium]|nr:VOC family protein [Caulobacteraceae bacterium]